jgi:hypothetical protein
VLWDERMNEAPLLWEKAKDAASGWLRFLAGSFRSLPSIVFSNARRKI